MIIFNQNCLFVKTTFIALMVSTAFAYRSLCSSNLMLNKWVIASLEISHLCLFSWFCSPTFFICIFYIPILLTVSSVGFIWESKYWYLCSVSVWNTRCLYSCIDISSFSSAFEPTAMFLIDLNIIYLSFHILNLISISCIQFNATYIEYLTWNH